jgi:hypothetical protein
MKFRTVGAYILKLEPPIEWITAALSLGVKRPEYEADRSPPSIAKVSISISIYCIFHKSMYIDIESVMNIKYKM